MRNTTEEILDLSRSNIGVEQADGFGPQREADSLALACVACGVELDFQILIHGENDYEPAPYKGDWQTSKVFGKKFRLRRTKDELGDVDYRLDVK